MAHQSAQHYVPAGYLRAWLEPVTPVGQKAAIHRFAKDGTNSYRKAPEKTFRMNNLYTIYLPNGERNLLVETSLGQIEDRFCRAMQRVRRHEALSVHDRRAMAMFLAAQFGRSPRRGQHLASFMERVAAQAEQLEERHGSTKEGSEALRANTKLAQIDTLKSAIEVMTPVFSSMNWTILTTSEDLGFLTSDDPAIMFDPKSHTLPPGAPAPTVTNPRIEILLPLTPHACLLLLHKRHYEQLYVPANDNCVLEVNRTIVAFADKEFVSWKGKSRVGWFERYTPPASEVWKPE